MMLNRKWKTIGTLAMAWSLVMGCAISPRQTIARDIASNSSSERIMESHFQALMNGQAPEQEMINYVDQLFHLLIRVNQEIAIFDQELDFKLALIKKNSKTKIEEPLSSKTYARILKMWQLRDRYQTELNYFALRILQTQNDPRLTAKQRDDAKRMQENVISYLKNTNELERYELQDLLREFNEVVQTYKEAMAKPSPLPLTPPRSFGEALQSKDLSALRSYIQAHPEPPSLPKTAAEKKRQSRFIEKIDRDLNLIPEPVFHGDRIPQSLQNLECEDRKNLCISVGENGNISGAIFPPGIWALTYDDGPASKSTGELLEVLHHHSDSVNPTAKATFFWLAKNVPHYPNWVKKAHDYGNIFENHSFTHADLHKLNTQERAHEVIDANRVLTAEYQKVQSDYVIQYFRCPYGSCYAPKIPEVRQMIAAQKQIHVYWRIDSLDWKLLDGPKIADLVKKQIQILDHGVILMHDTHPTTVEATKLILNWIKDQNDNQNKRYKLVTIPEAVDLVNGVQN